MPQQHKVAIMPIFSIPLPPVWEPSVHLLVYFPTCGTAVSGNSTSWGLSWSPLVSSASRETPETQWDL